MTENRPILSLKRKPADTIPSASHLLTGGKKQVVPEKVRQPITAAAVKPSTSTPVVTVNPAITPTDLPVTVKKKKRSKNPPS